MQQLFANNVSTTLGSNLGSSDMTISLASGGGSSFPSPSGNQFFLINVDNGTTTEIIKISGRSGDTLTVASGGRAQEGTSAGTFSSGTVVQLRVTAGTLAGFSTSLIPTTSLSNLVSPAASFGTGYICATQDDQGNATSVIRKTDTEWTFLNYSPVNYCTVTGATTTSVSTTGSVTIGTLVGGRFILQFISGPYTGYVRAIASKSLTAGTTLSWSDALGGVPANGTAFVIYQSQASIIANIFTGSTFAQSSRQIATAAGLSGGGNLTADRTIALNINALPVDTSPDTANDFLLSYDVSTGLHKVIHPSSIMPGADTTVVHQTRLISTGAGLAGGGDLSGDRTLTLDLSSLSLLGTSLGSSDRIPVYNVAGSITRYVTVSTLTSGGGVSGSRAINTDAGLTGGGDLTADRTISLNVGGLTEITTISDPFHQYFLVYDSNTNTHYKISEANYQIYLTGVGGGG